MKKKIKLKPQKINFEILKKLENLQLIKTLDVPKVIKRSPQADMVETIYSSELINGAHKLICVRKNQTAISLNYHSDNEDLIFIATREIKYKPLYLIIAYDNIKIFNEKILRDELVSADFVALEIEYNNPSLCYFTLLKNVLHCEITTEGDFCEAPIFFVTEPTDMTMTTVECALELILG